MKKYPNLSSPIRIGSVEIKNRMMMAPMDTGFGNTEWGGFTQESIDYFVRRAEGASAFCFPAAPTETALWTAVTAF